MVLELFPMDSFLADVSTSSGPSLIAWPYDVCRAKGDAPAIRANIMAVVKNGLERYMPRVTEMNATTSQGKAFALRSGVSQSTHMPSGSKYN